MADAQQLYIEDFAPGQSFPGASTTCTVKHFLDFARITGDAHPIHYDAEYAAKTRFGRPLAHGLLVAAYSALGATALSTMLAESMVAMLEVSFRYRKPVFADDVLTSHFEVTEVSRDAAKDAGRIRFKVTLTNHAGETVVEGSHDYLMRARGKAA
jgi:acyl dehydratase